MKGQTGAAGATGAIGPSKAFSVFNDAATAMTDPDQTVVPLNLPAGDYMVSSMAWAVRTETGSGAFARCTLAGGGQTDSTGQDLPDSYAADGSLANQLVFSSGAPAVVTLSCYGYQTRLLWKKIAAVKVGSVSNVGGPNVAKVPSSLDKK